MTDSLDAQPWAGGWHQHCVRCPSPHFDMRPLGLEPDLIVLHCISLPPGEFGGGHVHDFFAGRLQAAAHPYFEKIADIRVSAHFLIEREGRVTQFVDVWQRAWHAGLSRYRGRPACNDFSIGIELEGLDDGASFMPSQYERLADLIEAMIAAIPTLSWRRVAAHSEIAPGRKRDPGPGFDWEALYRYAPISAQQRLPALTEAL